MIFRKQACIKTNNGLLLLKLNADEYLKFLTSSKKCTLFKIKYILKSRYRCLAWVFILYSKFKRYLSLVHTVPVYVPVGPGRLEPVDRVNQDES